MNGAELFDIYKSLKNKEQKNFEDLYLAYKDRELQDEYEKLDLLNHRAGAAQSLQNIYNTDGTPYLDINWIMKNILKFTDEEIEEAKAKK